MKNKYIKIIGIVLIIIFLFIIYFLISKTNLFWPQYTNNEYNFSIKHPVVLGTWRYIPIPALFTKNTNCNNEFSPPNNSYDSIINLDLEKIEDEYNIFKLDNDPKLFNYDNFIFLYGSGDCMQEETKRKISIYIYMNQDNLSFDDFIKDSFKIYKTYYEHYFNEPESGWKSWFEPVLIKNSDNENAIFQVNPPKSAIYKNDKPRNLIYYKYLPNGMIFILTATEYDIAKNMISSLKVQ